MQKNSTTIVPETTGTRLISVWEDFYERLPIIAWRIEDYSNERSDIFAAHPVVPDDHSDTFFYEYVDRQGNPYAWEIPVDSYWDTFEAALKRAHENRQEISSFRAAHQTKATK